MCGLRPPLPRGPRDGGACGREVHHSVLADFRERLAIDWDGQQVTCPQGKVSRRWSTPPSLAAYVNAEFAPDDCRHPPGRLN